MNIKNTKSVDLDYPKSGGTEAIVINLQDVRAAGSLLVRYNFERDGWEILTQEELEGINQLNWELTTFIANPLRD